MHISEVSIRRPVFAWMIMGALIIFGWICFKQMGVGLLPDVDFPMANISVTYEGAAPEVMEADIVDTIESAVMSIQGIKNVTSTARVGTANISIEFELNKNIDVAVQEVQTALAHIQKKLPKDVDPPTVSKVNPDDNPILWMAVTSKTMSPKDLMTFVRDRLKDRFATVDGVGDIFLGGYVEPALRVWVSAAKLNQNDLTVQDIVNTIQTEHSELPAGRVETAKNEMQIRTIGEAQTVEDFGNLVINRRGGGANFHPIPLKQVVEIEDGLDDVRRKSRSQGEVAVGLGVRKQRGTNAVAVADAVKARMQEIRGELPPDVKIEVRSDSTKFISEAVHELNFTLILSALLTALVCWLFLGSLSSTLNVVLAIPTSVLGSFIVLSILGFTLNTFTLLALSLAIGIVVDDAIMVLENIVRHAEMGKNRVLAALAGSREITFAAIAATAAIIAIFLPVAFMSGIIGKFLYQFGVTLAVAVALSLLEALTLTPMRCSQFMSVKERTSWIGRGVEHTFAKLAQWYRSSLEIVLKHRWKTVLATILFFVASMGITKKLKKEFVPPEDQSMLLLRLQAPNGSSLDFTDKKMVELENMLMKAPEFEGYFSAVGGFGGGDVNTGMVFVTLKEPGKRPVDPVKKHRLSQQEFADVIREHLKSITGVKVMVQDLSLSGFSGRRGFPIEFTILGPDWQTLIDSSEKLKQKMEKSGLMTDVDSDFQAGLPEFQVIPDRRRARERGVAVADIDDTVSVLFGGAYAGRYSSHGRRADIRVRLVPEDRDSIDDIKRLRVRNSYGETVPLMDVATIKQAPSMLAISRQNRERAISVFANVAPKSSQAEAMEAVQKQAAQVLPKGYHLAVSGSAEAFKESGRGLVLALAMGLLISYMVLASQFNSFIDPFTVLMALPFSFTGAFLALWLGHQSLNMYSMIGLVLLMGIVKKNSILLVDFTNEVRLRGKNVKDSLLEACPIRLRPILMTSVATIAGVIPAALAIGPGAESRIPMALAILGGVMVSTVLTLFVVPCVYSLVARKKVPVELDTAGVEGAQATTNGQRAGDGHGERATANGSSEISL
jgi:HAE1 family hydrophobic/amphiphilic exporter-1